MKERFDLQKLRIIEREYEGILLERGTQNDDVETIYVYKKMPEGAQLVGHIKSNESRISDYELRTKLVTVIRD